MPTPFTSGEGESGIARVTTFARQMICLERARAKRPEPSQHWPPVLRKPWSRAAEPMGKWLHDYRLNQTQGNVDPRSPGPGTVFDKNKGGQ